VWTEEWRSPVERLGAIERSLQATGAVVVRGGEHDSWDLEVRGGAIGGVRLLMMVEEHGRGRQLSRFRWWPRFHGGWAAVGVTLLLLSVGAGLARRWVPSGFLFSVAMLIVTAGWRQCGAASHVVGANTRSGQ
jgi:hypothetical protein